MPQPTRHNVPDCQWPCTRGLEIPILRSDMQADAWDLPVLPWGALSGRKNINRGSWHFFCDDYRFASIWSNPDVVLATECATVVEPNFSIFDQTPRWVAIEQIAKKRWLSRYWQERGVRVAVDLNVAERFARLNLQGVPRGWRAYATHGYSDRLDDLAREHSLAREHRGSDDIMMLVYGGGHAVSDWCAKVDPEHVLHVGEQRTKARERKQSEKAAASLKLVS